MHRRLTELNLRWLVPLAALGGCTIPDLPPEELGDAASLGPDDADDSSFPDHTVGPIHTEGGADAFKEPSADGESAESSTQPEASGSDGEGNPPFDGTAPSLEGGGPSVDGSGPSVDGSGGGTSLDGSTVSKDGTAPSVDASGPRVDGGCASGTTRCNGAVLQSCEADGGWSAGAVTSGQCGAQCTPGSTPACNGAVPQSCSASGVLTTSPVTSGQCGAQCTPGSTPACNGAVPQSCSASGVLTMGTITVGQCGAVCIVGQYQCGTSQIGQQCGSLGTWISNGSSDPCGCYVPGRFTAVSSTLALDTTTGLTWDRSERTPDTWTNASTICNNAGMRLPTTTEWTNVALLTPTTGTSDGPNGCQFNPAPFDQAAMPTTNPDIGCGGTLCDLWTGTPESGFPGNVIVMQFFGPSSGTWGTGASDDATTGITHSYRCVK